MGQAQIQHVNGDIKQQERSHEDTANIGKVSNSNRIISEARFYKHSHGYCANGRHVVLKTTD